LRKERDRAGLTQDQVANDMDWSPSKIARIEAGSVSVSVTDLRALLNRYGVQNAKRVDELVDMARAAKRRVNWVDKYRDLLSSSLYELISLESEAFAIRYFHPTIVPGLLQTKAYAQAILRGVVPQLGDAEVDAKVAVRMTRQEQVLQREESPVEVIAVLDESVLRRTVADPPTMAEQLNHLVDLTKQDTCTIQVLPLDLRRAHPAMIGSFVHLEFSGAGDDDVAFHEGPLGEVLVRDRPDEVTRYRKVHELLRELALDPADSRSLISELVKDLLR
jgi:transcriptional regulator with XRE-family HTH domain